MSTVIKAKRTLRSNLANGMRFTEFEYTYYMDGKDLSDSFELLTEDYDFKAVWTIMHNDWDGNCKWTQIFLKESNEKFFGSYCVKTSKGFVFEKPFGENPESFRGFLNMESVGLRGNITIKIQVYRGEKKLCIIEAYDELLHDKNLSDVVFVVEGEEILGCKNILSSRSEVFASMFGSDMIEKKTGKVEIKDIEPAIFKMLLRFTYSGQLDCDDTDELLKLAVAADKYALKSLVDACGLGIYDKLTVDNAVEILIVADTVSAEFLKKECIDFIIKNKDEIVIKESYESMLKSNAHLLSEIFCKLKCVVDY